MVTACCFDGYDAAQRHHRSSDRSLEMADHPGPYPRHRIAFIVFLIAGNAEANRGPFDLAEAESELTAGYHTEYSGMGFGYFYLAEYLNLVVIAGLATTVFLGGWAPLNIGVAGFDNVMNYIPGFHLVRW
jgi:NADH:ubiquinone oxidoreductase subunit H